MFGTVPSSREDSRPAVAAPRPALAHTAAEAAAIIGGTCKASWLKAQAREGKIPYLWIGGAYNFTDAHIREIIALCEVRARPAKAAPPAPAKSTPAKRKADAPFSIPAAEVVQLRARAPRNRSVA
jgi:hypothetical protein